MAQEGTVERHFKKGGNEQMTIILGFVSFTVAKLAAMVALAHRVGLL
jgi:hypothetical protein